MNNMITIKLDRGCPNGKIPPAGTIFQEKKPFSVFMHCDLDL